MKPSDREILKDKEILYLDNHLLVVVKKANLLTQPNDTNALNLTDIAKEFIKKKYNKKGKVFLHPIHRLDKEVKGIVIFARTSKALSRLNDQMRNQKIKKKYFAEVEGFLENKKGQLKNYILHSSHKAKIANQNIKGSKLAHLRYEVIKESKSTSIVEVELITGRYHQIRAQLSYNGNPILGDRKYGAKKALKKIHLICFYMSFLHPVSKKSMKFKINHDFRSSSG